MPGQAAETRDRGARGPFGHRPLLRPLLALGLTSLLAVCTACAPRIIVRANPGPSDTGVRYYRPKPYLKVEPAEVAVDRSATTVVPGLVRISLAYLPDFSEEYSIDVRTGFGTADVGIKLEDGWNLTEISQDLDSQTDENLRAIGEVLSGVGDIVPTRSTAGDGVGFTVPARNVPIGFYEAVVGRDGEGCKRLYGFRYVGFMPYAACPVEMNGHDHACCGDPLSAMYGLTFANGEMVFQPLSWMSTAPAAEIESEAVPVPATLEQSAPSPAPSGWDSEQLAVQLRAFLRSVNDGVLEVRVDLTSAPPQVEILAAAAVPELEIRQAAEQWLAERTPQVAWDVRLIARPQR